MDDNKQLTSTTTARSFEQPFQITLSVMAAQGDGLRPTFMAITSNGDEPTLGDTQPDFNNPTEVMAALHALVEKFKAELPEREAAAKKLFDEAFAETEKQKVEEEIARQKRAVAKTKTASTKVTAAKKADLTAAPLLEETLTEAKDQSAAQGHVAEADISNEETEEIEGEETTEEADADTDAEGDPPQAAPPQAAQQPALITPIAAPGSVKIAKTLALPSAPPALAKTPKKAAPAPALVEAPSDESLFG